MVAKEERRFFKLQRAELPKCGLAINYLQTKDFG